MPRAAARDAVASSAVLACVLVALVALAGAAAGPVAMALGVPAGLLAAGVRRRLELQREGLRRLSLQDALTGLGNRRLLHERLGYEIARHRRHERRFCVLVLDLDGFKLVNDRFGHQTGDEVLREVARGLARAVRDQDTVARLGGDEFCVLAPEASRETGEQLALRLRRSVSGAVGGLPELDVSVGYAMFPDDGWDADHLLAHADDVAMAIKRDRGRSRPRRAA